MGIDWKNIDKILNIGAPKSVNKIIQKEQEDQIISTMEFQKQFLFLQINLNI